MAVVALVGFPFAMIHGHGRRASDRWARIGDSWLGIIWVLFSWTVIGELADLVLLLAGMPTPRASARRRIAVLVVAIVLCCWGNYQARRVPPVRRTEITLDRLGAGLDGLTDRADRGHPLRPDQPGRLVRQDGGRGQPARTRT